MNYTRFVTTIAALLGLLVAGQAAALPSHFQRGFNHICDVNYFGRLATIKMAGWVG